SDLKVRLCASVEAGMQSQEPRHRLRQCLSSGLSATHTKRHYRLRVEPCPCADSLEWSTRPCLAARTQRHLRLRWRLRTPLSPVERDRNLSAVRSDLSPATGQSTQSGPASPASERDHRSRYRLSAVQCQPRRYRGRPGSAPDWSNY